MNLPAFQKSYEGRCVLDFSGISLEQGKVYGIIGANGSGKSTFAKVLAGIIKPDTKMPTFSATVGYMPQKNYAFRLSTRSNIMLGNKDEKKAEHLMDAFQIRHLEKKRADKLSGGETARMALARLMMKQYDLVILDEPTAAMDMETTLISEQLILDYVKESGCALLIVTHSLQQARRMADEIMYFHNGQLLEMGETAQVLQEPQKVQTRQFIEFYGL